MKQKNKRVSAKSIIMGILNQPHIKIMFYDGKILLESGFDEMLNPIAWLTWDEFKYIKSLKKDIPICDVDGILTDDDY